jgi:hypothetical protein
MDEVGGASAPISPPEPPVESAPPSAPVSEVPGVASPESSPAIKPVSDGFESGGAARSFRDQGDSFSVAAAGRSAGMPDLTGGATPPREQPRAGDAAGQPPAGSEREWQQRFNDNFQRLLAAERGKANPRLGDELTEEAARLSGTRPAPDTAVDGHFITPDGKTHAPGTPLGQVVPGEGPLTVHVNGIQNNAPTQAGDLEAIQRAGGVNPRLVGIHNAETTMPGDLAQSVGDKAGIGRNPAVDTLRQTVLDEVRGGRDLHLMGHSQGALIISRAMGEARQSLSDDHFARLKAEAPPVAPGRGFFERQQQQAGQLRQEANRLAEQQLSRVRVETFGGAAHSYPDGPRYTHYINRNDPVAMGAGLGRPVRSPGRDADMRFFTSGSFGIGAHGFRDHYLPRRTP